VEAVLETAIHQFHRAADRAELGDDMRALLTSFKTVYQTEFPVDMDDGSVRVFCGYRVHHNTARGPVRVEFVTRRWCPWTRSRHWRCG